MKRLTILCLSAIALFSCNNSSGNGDSVFEGNYVKRRVMFMNGFEENRSKILTEQGISPRDFIAWSTDSAWSLPAYAQTALKNVRTAIETPNDGVLLQKVIALEDIGVYMNNTYGGTIGGFVSVAADMKNVSNMFDTYWGLRLDYSGTKFKPDGAGYAVIRFYSDAASLLTIPFCAEMGGKQPHAWPNTGGGFTASKLSAGGYPEYVFAGYSAPRSGAELYEVTPQGREILRSVYSNVKGWQTNEIGSPAPQPSTKAETIRNGVYKTKGVNSFVTTYALYDGNVYIVRANIDGEYHLTTQTRYDNVPLTVVEKGIYGINIPISDVDKVWEEQIQF